MSQIKSLLARPLVIVMFGIAAIVLAVLIILLWPSSAAEHKSATTQTVSLAPVLTNAGVSASAVTASSGVITPVASAPAATVSPASAPSVTAVATVATVPASTPASASEVLTTDPAVAAEELDRLNDQNAELKKRKAELSKQLDISNKIIALKEQQLKESEQGGQ